MFYPPQIFYPPVPVIASTQKYPQNISKNEFKISKFRVGQCFKGTCGLYEIAQEKELGSGTYSQVKLVMDRSKQQTPYFALKIISKKVIAQYQAEKMIQQEILIQRSLDHQNVLAILDVFEDNEHLYLVLEYCQRGTLWDIVQKKQKITEDEAFPFIYQICLGLNFLHNLGIVHRDIKVIINKNKIIKKPENILVTEKGTVKICDFTWCIKLKFDEKAQPVICGTTEYMPPEVVSKCPHDKGVDVWSLGVLLVYLLHGKSPFYAKTQKEKIENVLAFKTIQLDETLSEDCQAFIHYILTRQPDERPNIRQLFYTRFMKKMIKKFELMTPYPEYKLDMSMASMRNSYSSYMTASSKTAPIMNQSFFPQNSYSDAKPIANKSTILQKAQNVTFVPMPSQHNQAVFSFGMDSSKQLVISKAKSANICGKQQLQK